MPHSPEFDYIRDLGVHRVLEPRGALPQPAWKLDNTPVARAGETLVDVAALHIDSASFTQIAQACDRDEERMKQHMLDIVSQRGKMHNPVTGSGGVLIGAVRELDDRFGEMHHLATGDTIVSLTSLSWLPLFIERIDTIQLDRCEVVLRGKAIFFRSNPLVKLPSRPAVGAGRSRPGRGRRASPRRGDGATWPASDRAGRGRNGRSAHPGSAAPAARIERRNHRRRVQRGGAAGYRRARLRGCAGAGRCHAAAGSGRAGTSRPAGAETTRQISPSTS